MNLFTASQIRKADEITTLKQGISPVALMERAAIAFVKEFVRNVKNDQQISILCGPGNNGGDGLAVARLLYQRGYTDLLVYVIAFSTKQSELQQVQLAELQKLPVPVRTIHTTADLTKISSGIIIDAVLGTGLNKPLNDAYAALAQYINSKELIVYAIDVPSGFPSEGILDDHVIAIKATLVITFQLPKLNFFFPESAAWLDDFKVVDIGLDAEFLNTTTTPWKLSLLPDIQQHLKSRPNFSHKGTFGHALIVAGHENTMGAAILASKACVYTGAGLTTACIPKSGLIALNTVLPEAMYVPQTQHTITQSANKYAAIAIGPGLGTLSDAKEILVSVLALKQSLVADADALNLFAAHLLLLNDLPAGSVLTPHMKEFDRLFGHHENWWTRLQTAKEKAMLLNCVIVLKNQYAFVVLPNGDVLINTTGNPAMASGGMGDVLTGMIVSFIAQGYTSEEAAVLACYVHGRSGDELARNKAVVTATMVIENISQVIGGMRIQ